MIDRLIKRQGYSKKKINGYRGNSVLYSRDEKTVVITRDINGEVNLTVCRIIKSITGHEQTRIANLTYKETLLFLLKMREMRGKLWT